VSIVAASDDESPGPPDSYWIADETYGPYIVAGLVTAESGTTGVETARSPRLSAWAENRLGPLVSGCFDESDAAPFSLFPTLCVGYRPRCDGRPIEQTSP